MQRVLLALSILFGILPVANVQAARVDQLIEEMARRNRAQDEAERREEEAEERRRARAKADAASAPAQRAPQRRVVNPERESKPAPRPARADVPRSASRENFRLGGRGSGGCGSRGGPGWRKPNGQCASWRD